MTMTMTKEKDQTRSPHHSHLFTQNITQTFIKDCKTIALYGSLNSVPPRRRLFSNRDDVDIHVVNMNNINIGNENQNDDSSYENDDLKTMLVPFVNLEYKEEKEDTEQRAYNYQYQYDPWMTKAYTILTSIHQMTSMLTSQQKEYTNQYLVISHECCMSKKESLILESKMATFFTGTTKQIDLLGQDIRKPSSSKKYGPSNNLSVMMIQHKQGILSHLLHELKSTMGIFDIMQKKRHRTTLNIIHEPLHVAYPFSKNCGGSSTATATTTNTSAAMDVSKKNKDDVITGVESKKGLFTGVKNNIIQFDTLQNHEIKNKYEDEMICFISKYDNDNEVEKQWMNDLSLPLPTLPQHHTSLQKKKMTNQKLQQQEQQQDIQTQSQHTHTNTTNTTNHNTIIKTSNTKNNNISYNHLLDETYKPPNEQDTRNYKSSLRQEKSLLQQSIQNTSLNQTEHIEMNMIQITALLNQFMTLIENQSKDVQFIHESTVESKGNVDKGNEQLIQARESKKGRNYFAWVFVSMALMLLFFNAILP